MLDVVLSSSWDRVLLQPSCTVVLPNLPDLSFTIQSSTQPCWGEELMQHSLYSPTGMFQHLLLLPHIPRISVVFSPDSSQLTSRAQQTLRADVRAWTADPMVYGKITGYADDTVRPDINQRLATERANTVLQVLQQDGLRPDHTQIVGVGIPPSSRLAGTAVSHPDHRRAVVVLQR